MDPESTVLPIKLSPNFAADIVPQGVRVGNVLLCGLLEIDLLISLDERHEEGVGDVIDLLKPCSPVKRGVDT